MTGHPGASQAQQRASDPAVTAWVNANAGSGKTHVLVNRVVRLLLEGSDPARIMCLTFTRAAAAEMANRLFGGLGKWIALDDQALRGELAKLGCPDAGDALLARARQLFTRALETPGGLKIQTIHAFCERVLQLFPVEAGIVPHFTMLDDRETAALLAEARDAVLAEARDRSGAALGMALADVAARVNADVFDRLLSQLLAKRSSLGALFGEEGGLAQAESRLRYLLSLEQGLTRDSVEQGLACDKAAYLRLAAALDEGTATEQKRAEHIRRICRVASLNLLDLRPILLTGDGGIRKTIANAPTLKANPWIEAFIQADQSRLHRGLGLIGDLDCLGATLSLLRLGSAMAQRFEQAKKARGAYDFEDLIARTGELLRDRPDAAWVLYKLDGGIEHLLIDEAQDTSPAQWQIIRALTDEFFAGEGRHGSKTRTLFVVGDRKQSIYSFQGADPAVFETVLEDVSRQVRGARQEFRPVDLSVSFRSTPEVLEAVDAVFAPGSAARRDVDGGVDRDWHHEANRRGIPGVVEIWPLELPGDKEEELPWQAPIDREPAHTPRRRLAKKLAETIKGWIGRRRLLARDRAVEAGDILILVRQRNGFFDAMIRALWNEGVPVAGADRLKLGENIAVLDLMALAQFAIMPEDDHALACILKSPLLARPLSEDELLHIAANRSPGTLWQRLAQEQGAPFMAAAALLRPLRAMAARARPFEFFSGVLAQARGRFLERLGSEANDAIDALLGRALDYEEENGTSLAGFVNWFEAEEIEIKRNMEPGSGQVRVMTVHGAKGLEAPIVILPDTTSLPDARKSDPLLMLDSGSDGHAKVPLWAVPKLEAGHSVMRLKEKQKAASLAEYRRLLYVAMTRAEDELYVCGHANREKLPEACWYETVRVALQARMTTLEDGAGWRLGAAPVPEPVSEKRQSTVESSLPEWIRRPVAASPAPEAGEPPERPGNEEAVARGILIHRILENLPDLPQAERQAYIAAAVRRGGGDAALARQIEMLTADPLLAQVLSADGHSEATLIAETPDGGIERRRIDRMLVTPEAILVADYKTDRQPPDTPEDCNPEYLMQLATYRDALRLTAPGKPLRFCIVWTEAPRLMPIPDQLLDRMAALRQPRP